MEGSINPGLVILIGMGVVFAGLILLIIAITVMNALFSLFGKKEPEKTAVQQNAAQSDDGIDHDELIAVVVAAIAAETNTDAKGIKVLSLKRI